MEYNQNKLLFFILIIVSFAESFNCRFHYSSFFQEEENSTTPSRTYYKNVSDIVGKLFLDSIKKPEFIANTSERCRNNLKFSYGGISKNLTYYFTKKILLDSSKNKNDVSTYKECMEKKYYYFDEKSGSYPFFKPTYMIVNVKLKQTKNITQSNYNEGDYVLGICVPRVCNNDEFKSLFLQIQKMLSYVLTISKEEELDVTLLDDSDESSKFNWYDSFYILVYILEMVFFFIVLFDFVPFSLLKCFFKNKRKRTSRLSSVKNNSIGSNGSTGSDPSSVNESNNKSYGKYNKQLFKKFKSCFNKRENSDELFTSVLTFSKLNNYSGLTYIKGLRGISMIGLVAGAIYFDMLNHPSTIFGEFAFVEILISFSYTVYFLGMRFSAPVLFSCSGYYLFYKFMCFLDDSYEDDQNRKKELEEKKNRVSVVNNSMKKNKIIDDDDDDDDFKERRPQDVKWSYLFRFILYQGHKMLMFFVIVIITRFVLYKLVATLKDNSPMWALYEIEYLRSTSIWDILLSFTTIPSFCTGEKFYKEFSILNYFWFVYNEIFFFILGVIIIFSAYRYKIRIDRLLIMFIPATFVLKLLYYFIFGGDINPNIYYYYKDYGKYMTTPFFNLPYYLIGLYFSSLNYVVQKGLTYEEAEKQDKSFLLLSIRNVNFLKSASKAFIYVLCGLAFIGLNLIVLVQYIYFTFRRATTKHDNNDDFILQLINTKDNHLYDFYSNTFIKIVFLFDIEVVVYLLHWICFAFYIKGNNFINDFFSNSFWLSLDKAYFSFLLSVNTTILYILPQLDTRINFNFYNILLYGIISFFVILLMAFLAYIFFELPLKRLIKFFLCKEETDESSVFNQYPIPAEVLLEGEGKEEEEEEEDVENNNFFFDKKYL